jgi:glycerol-3-phosphate dehydrogenase (NAD(P)+)
MNLAILGGGSWGTALAIVLAPRFPQTGKSKGIRLWLREADLAERMASSRENDIFLPGIQIPNSVQITNSLETALDHAQILLGVMPSHYAREVYDAARHYFTPEIRLVTATKGIERETLLRPSEVVEQSVTAAFPTCVLSGPTFAREVAKGEPAAVVISSASEDAASFIQSAFSGPSFRLYTNTDPIGVEVGAALKNVIAIAAGVCQGLGLGNNTQAALITRGLAEITRLAVRMGGQPKTLAGLAGLGDLVLTCNGDLSRNRMVGKELAAGKSLTEIVGSMKMVAEGVETCAAAMALAQKYGVDLPIIQQMHDVLYSSKSPRQAVRELMERSLKPE